MSKMVIALGGNALGNTPSEQKEAITKVSSVIGDLLSQGHKVVITHGNGPQVGMINSAFEQYHSSNEKTETMPFPECNAMSEGYIGYHLQNSIGNELNHRRLCKTVVTCVTQIIVDKDDPAFATPTKPIGSFYSKEEAKILENEKGLKMMEDAGRGYRRVVASPKPKDIVEKEAIKQLIDQNNVVIACGGGGIPVVKDNDDYIGVDAVIDKDFASAKLAELIGADTLGILTAVDNVFVNFGKKNQQELEKVTIEELEQYKQSSQFSKGSMLPKVEASIEFVQAQSGNTAIITSIDCIRDALSGQAGTIISKGDKLWEKIKQKENSRPPILM